MDDEKPFQLTAADLGKLLDAVDAADRLYRAMHAKDALKIAVRAEHKALGEKLAVLHE